MDAGRSFYVGNAKIDDVRDSGWFVGQFVPAELGLRHQKDVELKWGVHADGECRARPLAHGKGTTISVLVEGALAITFYTEVHTQEITLRNKGDYVVFPPDAVHSWVAVGPTIVMTIRFPSIEQERSEGPVSSSPSDLSSRKTSA